MKDSPAVIIFDINGNNAAGVDSAGGLYVSGKAAIGSPPASNPVTMAGVDESGNKQYLAVDTEGRTLVVLATDPALLPKMIDLFYRATIGAIVAQNFRRVITYTIPTGYSAYLIRFSTWQNETAYSRLVAQTNLGLLNVATNVYTAESSYTDPQFAGTVEAEVTTLFGAANNITVTVTYTNELGVGSRTGTFTIPKSSIVGARFVLALQTGDVGVRSIQNLSASPSGGAGAIKVLGFIQLAWHSNLSTTAGIDTQYQQGSIPFPQGTVLGIEFSGGTVAKERSLEALIQLVQ